MYGSISKYSTGKAGPGLTLYFLQSSRIPDLWEELVVTAFPLGAALQAKEREPRGRSLTFVVTQIGSEFSAA